MNDKLWTKSHVVRGNTSGALLKISVDACARATALCLHSKRGCLLAPALCRGSINARAGQLPCSMRVTDVLDRRDKAVERHNTAAASVRARIPFCFCVSVMLSKTWEPGPIRQRGNVR